MIKTIITSLLLVFIILFFSGVDDEYIDSSGTYVMGNTSDSSYYGEIEITQLNQDEIYLEFYVINLRNQNNGAFTDTLQYSNGQAIYSVHDDFGACKIKFQFYPNRIVANEFADSECQIYEFGNGISGNGTYIKQ